MLYSQSDILGNRYRNIEESPCSQSEMIVVFVLDETISQGINLTAMK